MKNYEIKYYDVLSFIYNNSGGNSAAVVLIIEQSDYDFDKKQSNNNFNKPEKIDYSFKKIKIINNIANKKYNRIALNNIYLTDKVMQKIAKRIGYSETAFVFLSSDLINNNYNNLKNNNYSNLIKNNYNTSINNSYFKKYTFNEFYVRFFTPEKEVDYCGHATLAVFKVLKNEGIINEGIFEEITNSYKIEVKIDSSGLILIKQNNPQFIKKIDFKEIRNLFLLDNEEKNIFNLKLYPEIVNTGLSDLIIPVKNRKILNDIVPDLKKISKIQKKYNLDDIHVFALNENIDDENKINRNVAIKIENDKIKNNKIFAYARNFSPLLGIDEESATGSASGSLVSYLYKYNILDYNRAKKGIFFLQGEVLNKDSLIFAKIEYENHKNIEDNLKSYDFNVYVGGYCKIKKNKFILI